MLALGIDPGTATTGYAVVREVGRSSAGGLLWRDHHASR